MNNERRKFLKLTGAVAMGSILLPSCAAKTTAPAIEMAPGAGADLSNFGLQLYTLRDDMPKDPAMVLKQVASFGYKQIESYEGAKGMFWGMGNTGFKKYMDDLGMTIVASHCDISKDFQKKAADAAAIGMKYLICPWLGPQKSLDEFKKAAARFNECGNICKTEGIQFAYHNHDYSFKPLEGQLPQDVMMNETDPSLVDFEMDIYWVVAGGQDPEAWFKKYKNRFRLCHVKDRSKTPGTDNGKNSVDLGTGSINWKQVLRTAADNGMKHFIVEQEAYPNGTPLEAVKVNAGYMKKLKI
ncbi:MAG TPA: sugar phosphate isomerase/epimerase [Chitinophagaceae bacterium]|nr:sugar phosphate isomerase/epimerase [Chitinophagaceae bacterium]